LYNLKTLCSYQTLRITVAAVFAAAFELRFSTLKIFNSFYVSPVPAVASSPSIFQSRRCQFCSPDSFHHALTIATLYSTVWMLSATPVNPECGSLTAWQREHCDSSTSLLFLETSNGCQ